MRLWSPKEEQYLINNYLSLTVEELADALSRTPGQVRAKKGRLGLNAQFLETQWSSEETSLLRQFYAVAGALAPINLYKLERLLGRDRANICRKAKALGLPVNNQRQKALTKTGKAPTRSKQYKIRFPRQFSDSSPHPRGMLGKQHSEETKKRLSEYIRAHPEKYKKPPLSQEQRDALARRGIERMRNGNTYSRTKKGWHVVGGKRYFYKSQWEVNYAKYLEFLKKAKHILDWEYEPDTFWFEKIRRGVRSYTPDFKVTYAGDKVEYHEVKGWMDTKSKTKLARMAKYYPQISLVLVDEPQYTALKRQLPSLFI